MHFFVARKKKKRKWGKLDENENEMNSFEKWLVVTTTITTKAATTTPSHLIK